MSQAIEEARSWIADCDWRDLEPEDIPELTADEITGCVGRHYEGGWQQFLRDSQLEATE